MQIAPGLDSRANMTVCYTCLAEGELLGTACLGMSCPATDSDHVSQAHFGNHSGKPCPMKTYNSNLVFTKSRFSALVSELWEHLDLWRGKSEWDACSH